MSCCFPDFVYQILGTKKEIKSQMVANWNKFEKAIYKDHSCFGKECDY